MIKFLCNKLGRDKGLEGFKSQGITPQYKLLSGDELCEALKAKLVEETQEVCDAYGRQEMIAELADVLEVINGLCKAYDIASQDVERARIEKYNDRGGFEKGLYVESLEMDEANPRVGHFRKSPEKYPEIEL